MNQLDRSRIFYLTLCILFGLCIVGTMDLEADGRVASTAPGETVEANAPDDDRYVLMEAGHVPGSRSDRASEDAEQREGIR